MRKKIKTSKLRVGMLIDEFCGAWLSHPFWRGKLKIDSQKDLDRVRESGVDEVWVIWDESMKIDDDEKQELSELADGGGKKKPLESVEVEISRMGAVSPASLGAELARAERIGRAACQAIEKLFADVEAGLPLDGDRAAKTVDSIADSVRRNPEAMLLVARDKEAGAYAGMHAVAVCALMVAVCEKMGMDKEAVDRHAMAGMLQDIGMVKVPREIIAKKEPLTDWEIERIREHALEGGRIAKKSSGLPAEAGWACAHHHERRDGSGYPQGLSGDEIPLVARLSALCDVYDALTSDRPARAGMSPAQATALLGRERDKYDPEAFQAFIKTVGIYPVGSLVRLASGRLAVVRAQSLESLIKPTVAVFYDLSKMGWIDPIELDLSGGADRITGREEESHYHLGDLRSLWRR